MAERDSSPPTPGQEYLQPYKSLVKKIQRHHPGFFRSLLEAQEAQRRAGEVRSTAILTDVPTDEELARSLCREYNLVNRSWPTRTLGTSTSPQGIEVPLRCGYSLSCVDAQTQTDPFPISAPAPVPSRSRDTHRSRSPSRNIPYRRDTNDPAPILRENFSRSSPRPVPDQPSPVPDMEVDSPRDPLPRECWNCQKFGQWYSECSELKAYFCYKCGKPNVRVDNCPKCYRSYQPPPERL